MKNFGWTLIAMGAGSFLLNLIDYEFMLLMWIDNWGLEVGWAIRGVMIVAGAALLFTGGAEEDTESAETE